MDPQHTYKKLKTAAYACDLSTGEAQTAGTLGLAGQQAYRAPGLVKDLISKDKVEQD